MNPFFEILVITAIVFLLFGIGFVITDGIMAYSDLAEFHPPAPEWNPEQDPGLD